MFVWHSHVVVVIRDLRSCFCCAIPILLCLRNLRTRMFVPQKDVLLRFKSQGYIMNLIKIRTHTGFNFQNRVTTVGCTYIYL
jgi:hypothetical protein